MCRKKCCSTHEILATGAVNSASANNPKGQAAAATANTPATVARDEAAPASGAKVIVIDATQNIAKKVIH